MTTLKLRIILVLFQTGCGHVKGYTKKKKKKSRGKFHSAVGYILINFMQQAF